MEMRLWSIVLTMSCLVAVQRPNLAEDTPKPVSSLPTVDDLDLDLPFTSKTPLEPLDMKPLFDKVQTIVAKYYPKAKVTYDTKSQKIQFEYQTRKFMIHALQSHGNFAEEAHAEIGPGPDGIYGKIKLDARRYVPQVPLPHSWNQLYFTRLWMRPESERLGHSLDVDVKYPSQASKEFIDEMKRLANNFDKYIQPKTK